ncbi:MAG: DJ-1/PfpI family protein [Planctomycetota bacterium]
MNISRNHLLIWMFLAGLLLAGACAERRTDPKDKGAAQNGDAAQESVEDKGRVLLVIAPKKFRDEELKIPRKRLEKSGYSVEVASTNKTSCIGVMGMAVKPDLRLEEVDTKKYKGVVFVGGPGIQSLYDNADVLRIAREMDENEKVVSAICMAPVILGEAGLLKGKSVTVFKGKEEDCQRLGARITGENVTRDGRIVTGNGPHASREFVDTVIQTLEELDKKKKD